MLARSQLAMTWLTVTSHGSRRMKIKISSECISRLPTTSMEVVSRRKGHFQIARIAQSVERTTVSLNKVQDKAEGTLTLRHLSHIYSSLQLNRVVVGSIPTSGVLFCSILLIFVKFG
jgi:hypothetical protein